MALAAPTFSISGASTFNRISDFEPIRADWSNKKDIARCVRWMRGQSHLKDALEKRTARNIAFYEGRQNYEWDIKTRQMRMPDRDRRRMMLIYNVAKVLIDQRLARQARYDNAWKVPAATSDEYDQMIARFARQVMQWYWDEGLRMPERLLLQNLWMAVAPLTFVHVAWNPAKGRSIITPVSNFAPEDLPEDQRKSLIAEFRTLRGFDAPSMTVRQNEGDIDYQIVDIFKSMWYPFWAQRDEDIRIFLKTDIMTADEISVRYGLSASDIARLRGSSRGVDEGRMRYSRLADQWSNPLQPDTRVMGLDSSSGIAVHQLYVSKELVPPLGLSAIVLGDSDEALSIGTLGNRYGDWPFKSVVENPSPNTLWGTCTMDHLIAPSLDINIAKTRQAEWRDVVVSPRIVRDKQDGADSESFKATAKDAIIEVNDLATKMPKVLYVPNHGVEDEAAVAWDLKYMHDSSAVPDVALGNTDATNARSGVAVRSLQEEASQRMKLVGIRMDAVMSWAGSFILCLLQEYATGERLIPLVGDNNATEYFAWSRASLRPSIYNKQTSNVAIVRCTSFSNVPSSQIDMRNNFVALAQSGFFRPGEHDSLAAKIFGEDDMATVLDKDRRDRDKQENEIAMWRAGKLVPPASITDNHRVQREVLDPWIASDEAQRIINSNPILAQNILQHREDHAQGEYDEMVRQQLRLQWATMRVNAEFAERAASGGMVPQAQLFIAQSYAGMLPGGTPPVQDALIPADGSQQSPQDDRQRRGGSDNSPKPGTPNSQPGAQGARMGTRPNNDPNGAVQRSQPMGRDREYGSTV